MSRHGYQDDIDQKDFAMWRGRVASAMRGKRGQKMLRDLRDALDAMPEKRLVSRVLQTSDGDSCALGRLASYKGHDLTKHEGDDESDLFDLNTELAGLFNVAECLIQEVEYMNDDGAYKETPEQRWERMRRWVDRHIAQPPHAEASK